MVLDSFLCLIKPTNFLNWPIEHGNSDPVNKDRSIRYSNFQSFWNPFVEAFTSNYNLSIPKKLYYPIVPFRMKTSLVQQIISNDLMQAFLEADINSKDKNSISEFLIYSFYANHFDQPLTSDYVQLVHIIWHLHSEYPDDLTFITRNANTVFFGIRRDKLKDNRDKKSLTMITHSLSSLGLDKDIIKNYLQLQNTKLINY